MAQMVSPCCGHEYNNQIDDQGNEIYVCNNLKCNNEFDEPIEDYEFNEAAKEARDEDRADEARDMGE